MITRLRTVLLEVEKSDFFSRRSAFFQIVIIVEWFLSDYNCEYLSEYKVSHSNEGDFDGFSFCSEPIEEGLASIVAA